MKGAVLLLGALALLGLAGLVVAAKISRGGSDMPPLQPGLAAIAPPAAAPPTPSADASPAVIDATPVAPPVAEANWDETTVRPLALPLPDAVPGATRPSGDASLPGSLERTAQTWQIAGYRLILTHILAVDKTDLVLAMRLWVGRADLALFFITADRMDLEPSPNFAGIPPLPMGANVTGGSHPQVLARQWAGDNPCCASLKVVDLGPEP